MKLSEIASRLGGVLEGDDVEIRGVAGMEQAGPDELTFLANPKYGHKVKSCAAGAIIAAQPVSGMRTLVSKSPYVDFARALEMFYRPPELPVGISPLASISPGAVIAEGARIAPFAVVGEGARLGKRATLHAHAVIYDGVVAGDDLLMHSHSVIREHCVLGNRVILQNHVVVGADGYGFAKQADGTHYKIVQSGRVVIGDDVEIQSLSNIDRATVGETRVERGAKIDSLVQVGHASVVGEDNIICAQAGLAGSSILKRNVLLAGQAGVSGHLTIHDNAVVYAQSGIGHDVPAGTIVSGSPAFDFRDWRRAVTAFPKLGEMVKTLRDLEARVKDLEQNERKIDE